MNISECFDCLSITTWDRILKYAESNIAFAKIDLVLLEFVKLRAFCAFVFYMLTSLRVLRALIVARLKDAVCSPAFKCDKIFYWRQF